MATVTFDATITASPGSTFTGSLDYIEPVPASNYAAWSQEQANRGMSGGTILSNVTLAPDGTMTADKMVEAVDVNSVHRITVPSSIKGFATISMFVKPAERSALQIYHEDYDVNRQWSSASTSWRFSGTPALIQNYTGVPNSVRFINSTCVDLNNNGWYRLTFTTYNSLTTPGTPTFYISLVNGGNVNYYNGDGSSGLFIWGIQLEPGKVASSRYVPTNATGRSGFKVNLDGNSANIADIPMSPTLSLSLDFTNPALDSRLTFVRSDSTSCATRINSRGYLETVAANVPRFEWHPVTLQPLGLLLEQGSSNIMTHSNNFSSWNNGGSNVITANATISPDGSNNGWNIQSPTNANVSRTSTTVVNTEYTVSAYVKKNNCDLATIEVYSGNVGLGTITYNFNTRELSGILLYKLAEDAPNGWTRISATFTSHATLTNTDIFLYGNGGYTGQAGKSTYWYGIQLENKRHRTSYIATTTSTVSRSADLLSFNNNSWYSADCNTFYMEGDALHCGNESPLPLLSDTSGTEYITVRLPTRIGTWNGQAEANSTIGAGNILNGFKFANSFNSLGVITSLNGVSDQSGNGSQNILYPNNTTGYNHRNAGKEIIFYFLRDYTFHVKKFQNYLGKMSVAQANALTSGGNVYIGAHNTIARSTLEDLRPVYSTNLLGNSEGFTTGWGNNANRFTITQAPLVDGPQKLGVPTLLTRTSADASYISIGISNSRRTQFVFSVYAKKSVGDYCALRIQGNYPGLANVVFNLANGTISSAPSTYGDTINVFSSLSANIVSVGDGWYRLSLSAISDRWGFSSLISFNSNNTLIDSIDSVANSAGYLFGAQVEYGNVVGPYIKTVSGAKAGFNAPTFVLANCTDLTTKAGNIVRYSNMKTSNDSGFINASAGWDLGVDYSVTDPDGYRGARHFALGNASAPLRINSGSYVNTPEGSGTNQPKYAGQLWIRIADGGPNISLGMIQINDSNALVNFATTPITQTWQKFTFTVNNNGNPFQFIDIEFNASDAYRRIHIYGAQLELGTTNSAYVETGANKIMGISSNARFL